MDFFAQFVLALMMVVLTMVPGVAAGDMDAGDVIALLLGLTLGILGFCACLGHYARSRSGK